MPNDYHPVTAQINNLLQGCWHETFEHEAVRTSEEAARTRPGYTLSQGAKAIIVRVKKSAQDKHFVMLVFPADRAFDSRKVKAYFQAKDIRFATEQEVAELTSGVQVGGIPPFGNLFGLPVYAAPELFEHRKIVFNAGDRRFSVAMRSDDYKRLVEPIMIDML
jgi:prolyl-tRNA editing enzyme YbaK/EbsC (Cys-tRNA(Pro) deacylase)